MPGQTLHVTWHPDAVDRAIERCTAVTRTISPDTSIDVAGASLTWTDLACLLDLARTALAEIASEGVDWQAVAMKLALQGDGSFRRLSTREADAVRQLVDAERDRQDTAADVHADRTADAADGGEPR
jgi:hypothetical protein